MTLSMQPTLPIGKIVRGKNPREYFDPAEVAELEEGIRAVGVFESIVARPVPGSSLYEIIASERRWRVAKKRVRRRLRHAGGHQGRERRNG